MNLTCTNILQTSSLDNRAVQYSIMASSLNTNTDQTDSESSQAGWDTKNPSLSWVSTHYPFHASFAWQSSSSPHSQYSTIQLSPELGPSIFMTPQSTQNDPSISWFGSSSPSQGSISNTSGPGDFAWVDLMGNPEIEASSSASTETRTCKHHLHTQEALNKMPPISAEYVPIYTSASVLRLSHLT
jgi:hypothetical protein